MTPNDWNWELPTDYFYRTGRELFTHLSGQLTPELVDQIEQRLLELRNELMGRLTLFHYAAASGPPHQCIDDLYIQAVNRLRLFSLTMQTQKPAHPLQRQVPLTHEDVLDIFEQLIPADMPFGEERDERDTG
jgi:hypothetical protein